MSADDWEEFHSLVEELKAGLVGELGLLVKPTPKLTPKPKPAGEVEPLVKICITTEAIAEARRENDRRRAEAQLRLSDARRRLDRAAILYGSESPEGQRLLVELERQLLAARLGIGSERAAEPELESVFRFIQTRDLAGLGDAGSSYWRSPVEFVETHLARLPIVETPADFPDPRLVRLPIQLPIQPPSATELECRSSHFRLGGMLGMDRSARILRVEMPPDPRADLRYERLRLDGWTCELGPSWTGFVWTREDGGRLDHERVMRGRYDQRLPTNRRRKRQARRRRWTS